MGFFDFLRSPRPATTPSGPSDLSQYIEIARSPSGAFTIALDVDHAVLIERARQVARIGAVGAAASALVLDDGSWAIASDGPENPGCTLWIGNHVGVTLCRLGFQPNMYGLVGSAVADLAILQFCAPTRDADPSIVAVRLSTGQERWRLTELPFVDVRFDDREHVVTLMSRDHANVSAEVSYDGTIVSMPDRWRPLNGYDMAASASAAWLAGDSERARTLSHQALTMKISAFTQAPLFRSLGEDAEARGSVAEAIDFYAQALNANPKIGVKKRLDALKRTSP